MNEWNELNSEEEYLIESIIAFTKRLEAVRVRKNTIARSRDPPEQSQQQQGLRFIDVSRTVCWGNGLQGIHGKVWFTAKGEKAYQLLKLVYQAGNEGIEHQEVAERLFGDELANIKSPLQSARNTCERFGFPWIIENENGKFILRELRKNFESLEDD